MVWETNLSPGNPPGLWPATPTNSWFGIIGAEEPGSSAWLIASPSPVAVPEPSSLYIAGFGAVCGSVYVMGQNRRARRTATTGA